ncbi:transcription factor IIIB 90 kDa subunit [Condylostylus longicornis]|uniref:transcription factor IIIB 90 kDa subunit n=2 Tax=Condylostylus longicornis TaxID=2530218 RepID=UPI00244E0664|nr:transcription factor IIIB 90 kDa subunit [Condylostylus longicornis]
MSSGVKCKNCGSTEIEEDNARGDAVCTNCGSVLEDNLIVSEIQFEEIGHGSAAIGQFVSSDSAGGATGYGKFQVGSGTESREVTIKKAKIGITNLCQQLQLNNHFIETALNFFRMALNRHLTRGRKNSHIYAACVYITCRTEGTSHLLIDISDVLQICSYELGRTYLKLSNALCINIPSVDPCLYVMRFGNKLQFGSKTHEVSMTALRIVQRMKKDSIHSGRRPTGLCGAALLIAARMHDFGRSIGDIVKIVKIHESTLRKRLTEFAETPSSALTLDEFMAVDLEAEQDPPAFKAARKKDRERISKMGENELTELQKEIDAQLEKDLKKLHRSRFKNIPAECFEEDDATKFIAESNMNVIEKCLADYSGMNEIETSKTNLEGLKPDILKMCTPTLSEISQIESNKSESLTEIINTNDGELNLEGLDDEEIDGYIMTEKEADYKTILWENLNAEYLQSLKTKEEKLAREREEGKPEKKKRKPRKKIGPSNTAGEAIEKMLQEKKISTKINYDILKALTAPKTNNNAEEKTDIAHPKIEEAIIQKAETINGTLLTTVAVPKGISKREKLEFGLPVVENAVAQTNANEPLIIENNDDLVDEEIDEPEAEQYEQTDNEYSSLKDMLNKGDDDDYYGYDEDNY